MAKTSKLGNWKDRYFHQIEKIQEGLYADVEEIKDPNGRLVDIRIKNVKVSTKTIPGEQLEYQGKSFKTKAITKGKQTSGGYQPGDSFPIYYVLDVPEDKPVAPYTKYIMDALKKGVIKFEDIKPLLNDTIDFFKKHSSAKTYVMRLASSDSLTVDMAFYINSQIGGDTATPLHAKKFEYSLEGIEDAIEDVLKGTSAQPYRDEQGNTIRSTRRTVHTKPTLQILDFPYRTDEEAIGNVRDRYSWIKKLRTDDNFNKYVLISVRGLKKAGITDREIQNLKKQPLPSNVVKNTDPSKVHVSVKDVIWMKYQSSQTARARNYYDGKYPEIQDNAKYYKNWRKDFTKFNELLEWKEMIALITRRQKLKRLKKTKDKLKSQGKLTKIQLSKELGGQELASFKSKYDIGLYPDIGDRYLGKFLSEQGLDELVKNGTITLVQKAIIEALRGEAFVIIVDDNIMSGTDFRKIANGLENVIKDMEEAGLFTKGGISRQNIKLNFAGLVLYNIDYLRSKEILDTGEQVKGMIDKHVDDRTTLAKRIRDKYRYTKK